MQVVVTGANGHLGRALCSLLASQGVAVVAGVRQPHNPDRLRHLRTLDIPCADFDLGDAQGLAALFRGSNVVFHAAAPTQLWEKKAHRIYDPIYQGTLNVIRAAAEAGVKKIVYTSSGAAVGFHAPEHSLLAEKDYNVASKHPQFRAKAQSEIDGSILAKKLKIQLIRVCPPSVLGPGFSQASPSTEPYVHLVSGKLHAIPNLSYPIIDVRDLAAAQILLAFNEVRHERYIVAGEFVTTPRLLSLLREVDPTLKLPRLVFPTWSLPMLALLDALSHFAAFKKTRRQLTLDLARECSGANQLLCDKRFRSEFPGWSTRPLLTTIRETLDWIRTSHAQ